MYFGDYDEDGYPLTDRYELFSVLLNDPEAVECWWQGHKLEDAVAKLHQVLQTHGFNREFALLNTWEAGAARTVLRVCALWPVF